MLLPVLLTRERATLTGLRLRDLRSSVVAGLFLAAHFAAWLPSLSMTTVAASIALVTTTPIWTALAARIVRRPAAGGGVVGAGRWPSSGSALIAGVDVTVSREALVGDGLALLGAISAGGYVLAGARARERLATSAYTVVCYSVCAVVLAVAALLVRRAAGRVQRPRLVADRGHHLRRPAARAHAAQPGALVGRADGGQPRRPARGAGRADRRAGAARAGAAAAGAARAWRAVVVGVALVVRASRPTTLVEPAT